MYSFMYRSYCYRQRWEVKKVPEGRVEALGSYSPSTLAPYCASFVQPG